MAWAALIKPNKVTQMEKLKIENAEVVFASLTDTGFGTSLTIKVTPEIEKALTDFYAKTELAMKRRLSAFRISKITRERNKSTSKSMRAQNLPG